VEVLQRLMRPAARPRPGEVCELCGEGIPDEHTHLVHVEQRSLLCACRPCWLLFDRPGAGGRTYRAVPDRHLSFPDFTLAGVGWDDLQLPVGLVFLFHNSAVGGMVAFYPGPAGATESLLPLEAWDRVAAANPALSTLQPDVEALLLRADLATTGEGRPPECFLVPIDACYELVGHLRRLWRGFDGGQEAHRALDAFFDRVRGRARPCPAS
jgi:hypothetical protein